MAQFVLDPAESRFTVQAFARGMLSALAHDPVIAIRDFTGRMQFSPEAPENASLEMSIKADSLQVIDKVPPRDRPEVERAMRQDVLGTATYPEIKYQATTVSASKIANTWYRLQLRGELFLHGVTNSQLVDTQVRILDERIRLSGDFTLFLSNYRIKPVSAVGGLVSLKDELKFSFDIVGREEDS